MLQNPCKTLGFKKNMVYKIPPGGGEVNHIQPVAYIVTKQKCLNKLIQEINNNVCLLVCLSKNTDSL